MFNPLEIAMIKKGLTFYWPILHEAPVKQVNKSRLF